MILIGITYRYKGNNWYKPLFAEMIYIKKEKENSLNKITDTDSYSNAYNVIIDFLKLKLKYISKEIYKWLVRLQV